MKRAFLGLLLLVFSGCALKNEPNSAPTKTPNSASIPAANLSAAQIYELAKTAEIKKDFVGAKAHFKEACDLGISPACQDLGVLFVSEILGEKSGISADLKSAQIYFEKACKGGYCAGLGALRDEKFPFETPKNQQLANQMYEKSCNNGDALACELLGFSYKFGSGVQKSANLSKNLSEKACKLDIRRCAEI